MNYKDTIIKVENMSWTMPKFKKHKDGRNDLILTIPFTEILEQQAYVSFQGGVHALLKFTQEFGRQIDFGILLNAQLKVWGFGIEKKK